ncbi:MAG: hypothetical protein WDN28_32855 [Chthoniobacter sp.]
MKQVQHHVAEEEHGDRQDHRRAPGQIDRAAEGHRGHRGEIVQPGKIVAPQETGEDAIDNNNDQKEKRGEHSGYTGAKRRAINEENRGLPGLG